MTLWTPSVHMPIWDDCIAATPTTADPGTQIQAGTPANTKGSYTTLIASTSSDIKILALLFQDSGFSATTSDMLLDIAIGGAGSEVVILPDLPAGWTGLDTVNALSRTFTIPINIPAGTRISARCQAEVASRTVNIVVFVIGGADYPFPAYTAGDSYGITNSSASHGTDITPSATANTFGSWTSVGGTTSRYYNGLLFLPHGNVDATAVSALRIFEIGDGTNIWGRYYVIVNASELIYGPFPDVPMYRFIPSGTQMQVRCKANIANGEAVDVGLWGLY